jgi:hypothetical protein
MTQIQFIKNVQIDNLQTAVNGWLNNNRNDIEIVDIKFIEKLDGRPVQSGVMIVYTT